jgi:molecular chaperone GrpE (heat shock protein)
MKILIQNIIKQWQQKESEISENTVLEVMQKGYKLKSKLLRPALVIVSKKNQ